MNKKKLSVLKRISMLSAVIMLTLTAAFSLTACGKSNIPENTVFSADDLDGKSVGVPVIYMFPIWNLMAPELR